MSTADLEKNNGSIVDIIIKLLAEFLAKNMYNLINIKHTCVQNESTSTIIDNY